MATQAPVYPSNGAVNGLSRKLRAKRWALSKHHWLALFGGASLLIFGLSGLLHIVLVTWGPQQAVMMPPHTPLTIERARPIEQILSAADITSAAAVKITASFDRSMLQVTQDPMAPRRYFNLESGREIPGQDEAQAIFLARHYLQSDAPIKGTQFLTQFTPDYPWVNRLLPVYRVDFEGPGNTSIYVHTETNASAGVTNTFKRMVQTSFRWLHTWDWVPIRAEWARVALIAVLVGSLLALVLTGVTMLVTIRRKIKARGRRHMHRVAGYGLALPLLMFTSSGLYHLLTFSGPPPERILQLSQQLDLRSAAFPLQDQWQTLTQNRNVTGLSIISGPDGEPLYRLGLAAGKEPVKMSASDMRQARFDGLPTSGPALYVNAATGAPFKGGDKAIALALGQRFTGAANPKAATLVTRFGPLYDFRNKRLPVWQLDYGAPLSKTIWVDTATGALVDDLKESARPERWSFSMIHKWAFLRPLKKALGRHAPNIIIASVVCAAAVLMAGIGLTMYAKGRRRKRF